MLLAYMIAPIFQIVNIGTQLTEALAGLDRTMEILGEKMSSPIRPGSRRLQEIVGEVRFEDVQFSYEKDKPVLHGISFEAQPGTVTALVGSSGSGKSTIISLICAISHTGCGARAGGRGGSVDGAVGQLSFAAGVVLQDRSCSMGRSRTTFCSRIRRRTDEEFLSAWPDCARG